MVGGGAAGFEAGGGGRLPFTVRKRAIPRDGGPPRSRLSRLLPLAAARRGPGRSSVAARPVPLRRTRLPGFRTGVALGSGRMNHELSPIERGAVRKDWGGKLRVALVYPNVYRLGMANLGLHAVYRLLNDHPRAVCERAFLPEDPGETPVTLESGR